MSMVHRLPAQLTAVLAMPSLSGSVPTKTFPAFRNAPSASASLATTYRLSGATNRSGP